jgi:signal transduction histidine kinase
MSVVLLTSISIRIVAGIWSAILAWRVRDMRMGFLTAMLALMALRQGLTQWNRAEAMGSWDFVWSFDLSELPGLMVSVLAALAVFYLERILTSQRRSSEQLLEQSERLRQSQKLEAVGTLAGGVAHDFNNLLTAIGGHADLARNTLDKHSPAHENLQSITAAVNRAALVTRQILAFARKQPTVQLDFDPREGAAGFAAEPALGGY